MAGARSGLCVHVTLSLSVTIMAVSCRRCLTPFTPVRRSALFCSPACRTAAYRKRHAPLPETWWLGEHQEFSDRVSQVVNRDGTPELSRAALAERLLEIAAGEDDGEAKTGRRYWYLALSHGYVRPSMGADDEARKNRARAQKRITDILGILRKQGRLAWDMVLDLTRELDEWADV
jgi:hypothetical protein